MPSFPLTITEVTHTDAVEETEPPTKTLKIEEVEEEPLVEKEPIVEEEAEKPQKIKTDDEEKVAPPKLKGMNVPKAAFY